MSVGFYKRVPEMCKHDAGFRCKRGKDANVENYPAVWICNKLCGFFLNFDPDLFPDGIAFLEQPNPEGLKYLQPIEESK